MFITPAKMLGKIGGFRLGVRVTKSNAAYIWMVVFFVAIFKLMWYMMVLCFWLLYAMFYGVCWCIKQLFKKPRCDE